ncbi:hypothetical protein TPSD3_09265 [Thioflexithrix psekupsensis]|uniref:OmpA-like domain-containing protein n=1 Tax=Thioflexithrix psekupsensis TaxID=1570016 RepID=A0A251X964_9GAMM|nr:hypothetical protein TPSD3_09265 [Thioflexithrix psekupsensis]
MFYQKKETIVKTIRPFFILTLFFPLGSYAETPALNFPSNAIDIEQALQAPPKSIIFRGFNPNPTMRGVEEIVNDPPKVGAKILFDYDSATIKPDSYPLLKEYATALQNGLADAIITIAGHADSDGEADYNLDLSRRRAESVKTFLINNHSLPNQAPQRLRVEAHGEQQPIDTNETEEGKARNRRVEFIRIGTWNK